MFEVTLGRFLRPSVVIDFFAYFLPTLWCMNKVWVRKFPGGNKLDFAPELAISKGYNFLAFATAGGTRSVTFTLIVTALVSPDSNVSSFGSTEANITCLL